MLTDIQLQMERDLKRSKDHKGRLIMGQGPDGTQWKERPGVVSYEGVLWPINRMGFTCGWCGEDKAAMEPGPFHKPGCPHPFADGG